MAENVKATEEVVEEVVAEVVEVDVEKLNKRIKSLTNQVKKLKTENKELGETMEQAKTLIEQRNDETAMLAGNLQKANSLYTNLLEAVSSMLMGVDLSMKPYRESIQRHVDGVNMAQREQQQQMMANRRGE